ncbi:DGCR14-like protein [Oopsacas minuta]|uniref:DGCR14-like protein n=1 Tax=Oopsacas minuta TaxID=111878 RepID=A0AAV7KFC4_9METZ|nr:DGCR14-like protein [Oopsacas minuta]
MMSHKSVISEEKYEEALDTIIERDFFPDLKKFKDENRLLYPEFASSFDTNTRDKLSPRDGESLDEYLARIISEDDASFAELLQKDRERIREKCKEFFLGQIEHESPGQIEFKRPRDFTIGGKNSLMYVPEGIEQDSSARPNIRHENTRISKELIESLNDKAGLRVIQSELTKTRVEIPEKVDLYGKTILDPHVGREYGLISTPRTDDISTPTRSFSTPTLANTPGFKMKEASKREQIGIQLSEDIVRNKRNKRRAALRQAMHSLTPNTKNDLYSRGLYLSPAAKNLLKRTIPSARDSDSIGLRSSYTPNLQNTPSVRGFKKPPTDTPYSTTTTPTPNLRK